MLKNFNRFGKAIRLTLTFFVPSRIKLLAWHGHFLIR